MKLSSLIKTLEAALKEYGDVPAVLMNEERGYYHPVAQVVKLHPFTGIYGAMNRTQAVNSIFLSRMINNASDLVLDKGE